MFDNRAGNSTGIEGVHDYCCLFRTLCMPYYNVMGNDTSKDSIANTPSSLWVCMMSHQSSSYKQQNGAKRYFFDNFYTWHTVAEVLKKFTDGEAHLIGTVKFMNVDATNRYYLSKGMELLKNANRGSWCFVQAFHRHPDYEKLQNQRTTNIHRQGSSSNAATLFIPPLDNPAKNCGYIVFKDSKIVLFYTNDLAEDPPEPVLLGSNKRAIKCTWIDKNISLDWYRSIEQI